MLGATTKIWRTIVGWLLLCVGVLALVLPGPGLVLILVGLVVLANEYDWARRRIEPVEERAIGAARKGVSTVPRIVGSALAAAAIVAVGVVWGLDPTFPHVPVIGTRLPFGGWATGSGIILSGAIAAGLLVWSVIRLRGSDEDPAAIVNHPRSRTDPDAAGVKAEH